MNFRDLFAWLQSTWPIYSTHVWRALCAKKPQPIAQWTASSAYAIHGARASFWRRCVFQQPIIIMDLIIIIMRMYRPQSKWCVWCYVYRYIYYCYYYVVYIRITRMLMNIWVYVYLFIFSSLFGWTRATPKRWILIKVCCPTGIHRAWCSIMMYILCLWIDYGREAAGLTNCDDMLSSVVRWIARPSNGSCAPRRCPRIAPRTLIYIHPERVHHRQRFINENCLSAVWNVGQTRHYYLYIYRQMPP